MAIVLAVRLYDLAERALRTWGACVDVVEAYQLAAYALEDAGQSYLASVAHARASLVASLA